MPGLADLIATAGLATDDPDEGSGPAQRAWAGCSTGMGAVAGLLHRGTVADGLLLVCTAGAREFPTM